MTSMSWCARLGGSGVRSRAASSSSAGSTLHLAAASTRRVAVAEAMAPPCLFVGGRLPRKPLPRIPDREPALHLIDLALLRLDHVLGDLRELGALR